MLVTLSLSSVCPHLRPWMGMRMCSLWCTVVCSPLMQMTTRCVVVGGRHSNCGCDLVV